MGDPPSGRRLSGILDAARPDEATNSRPRNVHFSLIGRRPPTLSAAADATVQR